MYSKEILIKCGGKFPGIKRCMIVGWSDSEGGELNFVSGFQTKIELPSVRDASAVDSLL